MEESEGPDKDITTQETKRIQVFIVASRADKLSMGVFFPVEISACKSKIMWLLEPTPGGQVGLLLATKLHCVDVKRSLIKKDDLHNIAHNV